LRKKASCRTGSSHHSAVGASPTTACAAELPALGGPRMSFGIASMAGSASASALPGTADDVLGGRTRGEPDGREEVGVGLSTCDASSSSKLRRAAVMAARLRASSKSGSAKPCDKDTTDLKRGIGPAHKTSSRGAGGGIRC
jgi:hypothetical protein